MMEPMTSAVPRPARLDIVIAAAVSALGALLMYDNAVRIARDGYVPGSEATAAIHFDGPLSPAWAIPLFLLVTVPVAWRRVAPLGASAAALAGLLVNELLLGSEYLRCGVTMIVAFLLAYSAGAQLGGFHALLGLILPVLLTAIDLAVSFGPAHAVVLGGLTAAFWVTGRIVRSRRRMAAELERRTEALQAARDERARLEVARDRVRLSRELDSLLQRRLSELAALAEDGEPSAATLVRIERESRRTLDEMRAMVGVLRADGEAEDASRIPAVAHLDALLIRARSGAAHVTVEGAPRKLPPGIELSAYRIVEHLLAAVEDAPGVEVRVRFDDDGLGLAVAGPAVRRGESAVKRARQRVQLHRGTLDASVRDGRAEAVVWLPVVAGA